MWPLTERPHLSGTLLSPGLCWHRQTPFRALAHRRRWQDTENGSVTFSGAADAVVLCMKVSKVPRSVVLGPAGHRLMKNWMVPSCWPDRIESRSKEAS